MYSVWSWIISNYWGVLVWMFLNGNKHVWINSGQSILGFYKAKIYLGSIRSVDKYLLFIFIKVALAKEVLVINTEQTSCQEPNLRHTPGKIGAMSHQSSNDVELIWFSPEKFNVIIYLLRLTTKVRLEKPFNNYHSYYVKFLWKRKRSVLSDGVVFSTQQFNLFTNFSCKNIYVKIVINNLVNPFTF